MAPYALLDQLNEPNGKQRLVIYLLLHRHGHGSAEGCWASTGTLAAEAGMKRDDVILCLKWLVSHGWAERVKDPGRASRYFLKADAPTPRKGTTPTSQKVGTPHFGATPQKGTTPTPQKGTTPTPQKATQTRTHEQEPRNKNPLESAYRFESGDFEPPFGALDQGLAGSPDGPPGGREPAAAEPQVIEVSVEEVAADDSRHSCASDTAGWAAPPPPAELVSGSGGALLRRSPGADAGSQGAERRRKPLADPFTSRRLPKSLVPSDLADCGALLADWWHGKQHGRNREAFGRTCEFLREFGPDDRLAILRTAVVGGYQGLFPPRRSPAGGRVDRMPLDQLNAQLSQFPALW